MNEQDNQEPIHVSAAQFLESLLADTTSEDSKLDLNPLLIADLGLVATDETGETFRWKSELERQIFGNAHFTDRISFASHGADLFIVPDAIGVCLKIANASEYVCKLKLFPDLTPKGNSL